MGETGHRHAADANLALAYRSWGDPEARAWVPTLLFYAVVQLSQFLLLFRAQWTAVPRTHQMRSRALVKSLGYTDKGYNRLQEISSRWRYYAMEPSPDELLEALRLAQLIAMGLGAPWAIKTPADVQDALDRTASETLPPMVQDAVARTVSATLLPAPC